MTKLVKIESFEDVLKALKDGNRPYMPGGYNTKDELRRIQKDWSQRAGFPLKITYSGENRHIYFIDKASATNKETAMAKATPAQLKAAIKKLSAMKSVQSYIKLRRALDKLEGTKEVTGFPAKAPKRVARVTAPPAMPKRRTPKGIDNLDDLEYDMGVVNSKLKKDLAAVKAAGYPKARIDGEGDLDADAAIVVIENNKGDNINIQIGRSYYALNIWNEAGMKSSSTAWQMTKSLPEAIKHLPKALSAAKKMGIKF